MTEFENPLEEMKKLRSEISFKAKEVESMIKESKKGWDR